MQDPPSLARFEIAITDNASLVKGLSLQFAPLIATLALGEIEIWPTNLITYLP